jgi:hypothetical protein
MKYFLCWLLHRPQYGECVWSSARPDTLRCRCTRCGTHYIVRTK